MSSTKATTESKKSKLFDTFVGEYVSVIVKGTKGQKDAKVANLVLTGYLVDECSEYYYMGEETMEVTASIRRTDVSVMMINRDGDLFDEVFEGDIQ